MKRYEKVMFITGQCAILLFILWTVLLNYVDVCEIGALDTKVGFATLNEYVHSATGVNMPLYTITDWLGLIPIGIAAGFAVLGLVQMIKRKGLLRVDYSLLALGIFYAAVIGVYILFENVVINYRPILIEGCLEASYPSSTTMLTACVIPTAIMQLKWRTGARIYYPLAFIMTAFLVFTVVCRILSGVHWISDIIGGALISAGLVLTYRAVGCYKR